MSIDKILELSLKKRRTDNSERKLSITDCTIDFSSNDYLGLARSKELFNKIQEKINNLPHLNGATGSRLLTGNNQYVETVERNLAAIFNAEGTLIFNSGYAANQAVLSSLPQKGDTILYDELSHACIRDGARLSLANRFSFRHNNLNDLEEKIKKAKGNVFIVVESIYSMDGDRCSLRELIGLSEKYKAHIILDEAHSTGVVGNNGNGLAVSLNLEEKIAARIYTFGKAMGVHGACVAGSKTLINYLINFGRTFIYTTAMPSHSIASIDCSFNYLASQSSLQQELTKNINYFIASADSKEIQRIQSNSQIQSIIIPGNDKVKLISKQLQEINLDVRPILSPTVPKESERLRICLHAYNTFEEIDILIGELSKVKV